MGQWRTADLSENCVTVLTLFRLPFCQKTSHKILLPVSLIGTGKHWKTSFEIKHGAVTWRRIERIRLRLKEILEKHAKEN